MDWLSVNSQEIILVLWGLSLLAGFFLALTRRATIYRNVGDVGFTCFVLVLPMVGLWYGQAKIFASVCLVVSACGLAVIIVKTYMDNRNPLYCIIAIITKFTFSFLFVAHAITVLFPPGNDVSEMRWNRSNSLLWLSVLTPLIYLLIRDRNLPVAAAPNPEAEQSLKAAMAAAHPDKGGSSAAFIDARQRYVAARRA